MNEVKAMETCSSDQACFPFGVASIERNVSFESLMLSSLHRSTPRPILFVKLFCAQVPKESVCVDYLYELFCEQSSRWWDDSPGTVGSFASILGNFFVVRRNRLQGWVVDENRRFCVIDVLSHGRCLVPMRTLIRANQLTLCPDEWVVKRERVKLSHTLVQGQRVFFAQPEDSSCHPSIGYEWSHMVTEEDERARRIADLSKSKRVEYLEKRSDAIAVSREPVDTVADVSQAKRTSRTSHKGQ